MERPIYTFLEEHAARNPVSFHMPGHKGNLELYKEAGYRVFFENPLAFDITEIEGADNLFQAESIIRETQKIYESLYGVKKSWLLINGTSGGILASVLASVKRGRKLVMARNCHKSVFNALTLGGIRPVFVRPELLPEYGVAGAVLPEAVDRALRENPDADAVILPSPNYYGICSDICRIAEIVHRYGKVLIVDEAHGAHLKLLGGKHISGFGKLPLSAVDCGADLVVNSIHKTLASFTQSAVLHLNSGRVDPALVADCLQAVESTSPSYLLMASLDLSADIVEKRGEELAENWISDLVWFYEESKTIPELLVMRNLAGMDGTKINFSLEKVGVTGLELDAFLREKHGVYCELVTGGLVMGMSGIGNRRADYRRLLRGLRDAAETLGKKRGTTESPVMGKAPEPGEFAKVPRQRKTVPLSKAAGEICAGMLIPYPPGIPLACPGERLTNSIVSYIDDLRRNGTKVLGVSEQRTVFVGADTEEK